MSVLSDKKYQDIFRRTVRISKYVVSAFVALMTILLLIVFFTLPKMGKLKQPRFTGEVVFTDFNDRIINTVIPNMPGKRSWVPISRVPITLIKTVVALEDIRFWHHGGVDFSQLYHAFLENIALAQYRYGASTITQQLIKNVFLNNEKTIIRKMREIMLALRIENRLNKQQIMEWYLNIIEMAYGIYGIEEGSRYYFGKSVYQLDFTEQVFLAAVIQSPRYFDAQRNRCVKKVRKLSSRLLRFGMINHNQATLLRNVKYKFVPRKFRKDDPLMWLLTRLARFLGGGQSKQHIKLSLDSRIQQKLEDQGKAISNTTSDAQLLLLSRWNRILGVLPVKKGTVLPNELSKSFSGYTMKIEPFSKQVAASIIIARTNTPITFTQRDLSLYLSHKKILSGLPGVK